MQTGQQFVKKLGVAGAIGVLILGIIATALMFTARGTPVEGYEPPEDMSIFREDPEALREEIQSGLIPLLELTSPVTVTVEGGLVRIEAEAAALQTVRLAVIHYYDADLFDFKELNT